MKEQLEQVKQQDRILEEIEKRLFKMKEIAAYAARYRLSGEEVRGEGHRVVIESLRKYLDS